MQFKHRKFVPSTWCFLGVNYRTKIEPNEKKKINSDSFLHNYCLFTLSRHKLIQYSLIFCYWKVDKARCKSVSLIWPFVKIKFNLISKFLTLGKTWFLDDSKGWIKKNNKFCCGFGLFWVCFFFPPIYRIN